MSRSYYYTSTTKVPHLSFGSNYCRLTATLWVRNYPILFRNVMNLSREKIFVESPGHEVAHRGISLGSDFSGKKDRERASCEQFKNIYYSTTAAEGATPAIAPLGSASKR